jgi:hypothetical protein
MAQVLINIPDGQVGRVIDGFGVRYEYDRNKLNGETKAAFAKRMLIGMIKQSVIDAETDAARAAAQATVITEVGAITID